MLINNLKIDILLTDIEMPGESGLDLVEWIREKELDMECIFMSSHADFEYAQRGAAFRRIQICTASLPVQ